MGYLTVEQSLKENGFEAGKHYHVFNIREISELKKIRFPTAEEMSRKGKLGKKILSRNKLKRLGVIAVGLRHSIVTKGGNPASASTQNRFKYFTICLDEGKFFLICEEISRRGLQGRPYYHPVMPIPSYVRLKEK